MSQMWHRMRGLANPTPAVEPGGVEQNEWDPGNDVILPDDHFSRLHNPQNGRVPPQLPSAAMRPHYPDFDLTQYQRYFRNSPATLDEQLGFTAQSVRIDNYSSHWLFFPSAGMFVPPYFYGVVLGLNPGVPVAQYNIQAPLGYTDPTPTLESNILTIWWESPLPPSSGSSLPASFRGGVAGGVTLNSNLLPSPDYTYNLGSATQRWFQLYIGYINAYSNLTVQGNVNFYCPVAFPVDNTYDIGASGANRPRNIYAAGIGNFGAQVVCSGQIQNWTGSGNNLYFGQTGAPAAGLGINGDFYFRSDTPGTANQRIYVKSAGAWVGIV